MYILCPKRPTGVSFSFQTPSKINSETTCFNIAVMFQRNSSHCACEDCNDSIQSWEEENKEEISHPDKAKDDKNQELVGNEQRSSISVICEQTHNCNCRVRKCKTVSEMNWGELDEFLDVAYPEFCSILSFIYWYIYSYSNFVQFHLQENLGWKA